MFLSFCVNNDQPYLVFLRSFISIIYVGWKNWQYLLRKINVWISYTCLFLLNMFCISLATGNYLFIFYEMLKCRRHGPYGNLNLLVASLFYAIYWDGLFYKTCNKHCQEKKKPSSWITILFHFKKYVTKWISFFSIVSIMWHYRLH